MTEQLVPLQTFSYLSLLETPGKEKIYRLVYDDTTRYFQFGDQSRCSRLLMEDGRVVTGSKLDALEEKITVYERLFGKSLESESLVNWLRIDEATFLLSELSMNRPDLEDRIHKRLVEYMQEQERKPFYDPLLLPKVLAHNEFVYDYLLTNIGHPDGTENYFNRMKIMIQQIGERTGYVEVPSYFSILQTLIIFIEEQELDIKNVIFQGLNNYCILRGGLETLPSSQYNFTGRKISYQLRESSHIINITNAVITRLIKIYNSLE